MAPLAIELNDCKSLEAHIGLSGQHKDMVNPILDFFGLKESFNLNISQYCKSIEDALSVSLPLLCEQMRKEKYDLILVHGDTSSTLVGALAGFYTNTPVGHVEAGLRSGSLKHPFPEEMNRKLTASLANYNFSATPQATQNLINEGISSRYIYETGNSVVDALRMAREILVKNIVLQRRLKSKFSFLDGSKHWILLTGHRRENLNQSLVDVVKSTVALAKKMDAQIIFPMHPNPMIKKLVDEASCYDERLFIIPPINYEEMVWLYTQLSLIVTDSGGIQEEAASFSIPTLVTRLVTERKESLEAGLSKLVGQDPSLILTEGEKYLLKEKLPNLKVGASAYGDGYTCRRIVEVIKKELLVEVSLDIDLYNFPLFTNSL